MGPAVRTKPEALRTKVPGYDGWDCADIVSLLDELMGLQTVRQAIARIGEPSSPDKASGRKEN
jgi:hypothetical protein